MSKILLFAALGTLGALLGAMISEPGFRMARDWANSFAPQGRGGSILTTPEPPSLAVPAQRQQEQDEVAAPEPPPLPKAFVGVAVPEPPPPPLEFATRLRRENAKTGDVQISLLWNNAADLDLECVDPNGELVFVTHPSKTGGTLDVDMNGTVSGIPTLKNAEQPVENIFWPKGKAPPGRYQVYVVHSGLYGAPATTPYEVNVLANGLRESHAGAIRFNGNQVHPVATRWLTGTARDLVCEFEVAALQPAAPRLAISVPPRMEITPGGVNHFQFKVARGFFEGNVRVELLDAAPDLDAKSVFVPQAASEGTMEVRAMEGASQGERRLKIVSYAETPIGTVRAEETMLLAVRCPAAVVEPVLKLSVPERINLEPGGAAVLKVRIGRWYFPIPATATVRLDDCGHGLLSSDVIQLMPSTDEGSLEIRAAPDARIGVRTVRVAVDLAAPFDAIHAAQSVEVAIVAPKPETTGAPWPMALAAGGWTAFVAIGLSLFLAIGQNHYLGRTLLGAKQATLLIPGSAVAGGVAGAIGQASASWVAGAATVGHFAGWLLLGALLGRGVAFFIPNLKGPLATAAGSVGGLFGAVALLAGTHGMGEIVGRGLGAGTLGLAIGAMVAWIELTCRSVWLECRYSSGEMFSVNLGPTPVRVGSDSRVCTVYAQGARALAAQYKINGAGRVVLLDYSSEREMPVVPGEERKFGAVTIAVRGSWTASPDLANADQPPANGCKPSTTVGPASVTPPQVKSLRPTRLPPPPPVPSRSPANSSRQPPPPPPKG